MEERERERTLEIQAINVKESASIIIASRSSPALDLADNQLPID